MSRASVTYEILPSGLICLIEIPEREKRENEVKINKKFVSYFTILMENINIQIQESQRIATG